MNNPCWDWKAVQDREPPPPYTLTVTATCSIPDTAHRYELRPTSQPYFNPRDRRLDLVLVTEVGDPITSLEWPLAYTEQSQGEYDTVTITNVEMSSIRVEVVSHQDDED